MRAVLRAICAIDVLAMVKPDRRGNVTLTKVILVALLLGSAIGGAFANPPGGSYIQCDPKNPRSPIRCTPDGW